MQKMSSIFTTLSQLSTYQASLDTANCIFECIYKVCSSSKMNSQMSNPELSVYVGNIDPNVTKAQLYELFVQVSPISKIAYPKDKLLQTHQGYAFIEFYTPEDTNYVVKVMNNTVSLYDRFLKVRKSVQNLPSSNNKTYTTSKQVEVLPIAKVFVKNLDESVDIQQLSNIFEKFGPLFKEPEIFYLSNNTLRCAHIFFKFYPDSDAAIGKLDNELIANKRINLDYAYKEGHTIGKGNNKYGSETDRLLNKEAKKNGLLL
ncbi:U2 snRNP complex subunit HSH49 NDAI_0E00470 [Naumovozyma dairenensis CBS 421]|uniref:RRM domain-containing protein n=1 Tax=Naumovozyma dairenensis (strain ATCC 10597 / BCRC 20456 / CBS 421 / NBRC 0211 / NRRL Y-12639) TaxID=1071378 RepID=G0WAU3_NAUDC|nr:hypothetical protein NDAI_0E00470 [Naumovozyma dairenensis CBS 421]CCD24863.1 hypothetical protein NDAI_0E00470 [Naumovozyma dairenensis CBS 421]